MREKKVRGLIETCIKGHEMNEHQYRREYLGRGRITTNISKDELLDLILEHLGLEVVEFEPRRRAELLPKEKE